MPEKPVPYKKQDQGKTDLKLSQDAGSVSKSKSPLFIVFYFFFFFFPFFFYESEKLAINTKKKLFC